ncbi:MAG: hypothetical protein ACQERN_09705 [Thermodesulfobacteriota bacterium]
MQLEQSPIFRKSAAPWYDSNTACGIVATVMAVLIFFGIVGIRVAARYPSGIWMIWLPALLLVLSATVLVSLLIRLIRRKTARE